MNGILDQIGDAIALHAPRILAALAILLVGWPRSHGRRCWC